MVRGRHFENIEGETYGRLLVLSRLDLPRKKGFSNSWYCICECGGTKVTSIGALRSGRTKSCGCLNAELKKLRTGVLASQYKNGKYSGIRRRLTEYQTAAVKRGYAFELSDETFFAMIGSACGYCGTSPCMGVDRIDNAIGYTPSNSVACCGICNRMKNTHSREFFYDHIRNILKLKDVS